jgi:hypothetical protein
MTGTASVPIVRLQPFGPALAVAAESRQGLTRRGLLGAMGAAGVAAAFIGAKAVRDRTGASAVTAARATSVTKPATRGPLLYSARRSPDWVSRG